MATSKLDIEVTDKGLAELTKTLADTPKQIPKETAIAINKTAKGHIIDIAKEFRKHIKINVKGSKEALEQDHKATPKKLGTIVRVKPMARLSLKRFGAKQSKAGVSYQIAKQGGKSVIPSAFGPNIARLGNHVFTRKNPYVPGGDKNANRALSKMKKGPSMLAVYEKHKMKKWSQKQVNVRLNKEIQKRVDFILYKRSPEAKKP